MKKIQLYLSILVALIVIFFVGFLVFNNYIHQEKQGLDKIFEPFRATLSGKYVCLPLVTDEEKQNNECVEGLKTDQGEYYKIDFYLMSQTHEPFSTGDRLTANGVITSIENLSTDYWQKYQIDGVFSVTDINYNEEKNEGKDIQSHNSVNIKLEGNKTISGVSIFPLEIISDSRCPMDVTCIWAGTVEVRTVLATEISHGEHILELNKPQIFGDYLIELTNVSPNKTEEIINDLDYSFEFRVSKK